MKKNHLLSILFVFAYILTSSAQSKPVDPVFSAITNIAEGNFIKIYLTSEDYFWIDWGDGTTKRYDKGTYGEDNPLYPGNGLKGNEIKIYGDDVTYIIANDCGFTSVEAYMTNKELWLEVSNNPLTSVSLDDCGMLGTFIANYCELSDIKLGMKKKLHTIEVSQNNLKSIDVSKCSNLKELNIAYNNIEGCLTLPSQITQLDASGNNITAIDCSNSKKIEYLMLRSNKITSLDLSDIKSLIMCDASENEISDVKFGGTYEYVTTVSLRKNKLTSVDFSTLTDIHAIDISDNQISNVDLSKNPSLTSFVADNNNLESIDLSNNNNINFLYLSGNKFKTIDLTSLTYLYDLRLDNNILEKVVMPTSKDLICVMLTNNNLGRNMVNDIIEVLPDVKDAYVYDWETDWKQHLNLEGNKEAPYADLSKAIAKGWILDIEQQDKPKEMKGFNVSLGIKDSYVFKINATEGTNVQILNASGDIIAESKTDNNKMADLIFTLPAGGSVKVQADADIEGFTAVGQMIKSIDFAGYNAIKCIDISNNEMDKLDVSNLLYLEELNCSSNNLPISELPLPGNIGIYEYAPQNPFAISYDDSGLLNLSNMFLCGNTESVFGVIGEKGTIYQQGTDFTINKGMISFLKPLGKVYVIVENAAFPDLTGDNVSRSAYFNVNVPLSIEQIEVTEDSIVYDLTGKRVTKPQNKGVYIIDGRKVVIK